jgi:FHA domain-containing protein
LVALSRTGTGKYGEQMRKSPLAAHSATPAELKARLEAERRGRPFLLFRDAEGGQCILELPAAAERVTIGRREGNDMTLDWDPDVSRLHAALERIGGDWTLVDDGLSRNGSYVNDSRVLGRRRLRNKDVLRFGECLVVYSEPERAASYPTGKAADAFTFGPLTEAQRKVLVALCRPLVESAHATPATNPEIAGELFLSVDAVKKHMRVLFEKFGVAELPQYEKRSRLVEQALAGGFVSERDL